MSAVLPWVLGGALLGHFATHMALVAGLARAGLWARAARALVIPPLAPWWSWEAGMRRRAGGWAATLAMYAVAIANA